MAIKTRAYPRKPDGIGARAITLTRRNAIQALFWLRSKEDGLNWKKGKTLDEAKPSLRVKTPKGVRVAVEGDTIVKYGTWWNGYEPYYEVVKG